MNRQKGRPFTSGYPILPTVSSNIFVERFLLTVRISDWEVRDVLEGTKGCMIMDQGACNPGTFLTTYH